MVCELYVNFLKASIYICIFIHSPSNSQSLHYIWKEKQIKNLNTLNENN